MWQWVHIHFRRLCSPHWRHTRQHIAPIQLRSRTQRYRREMSQQGRRHSCPLTSTTRRICLTLTEQLPHIPYTQQSDTGQKASNVRRVYPLVVVAGWLAGCTRCTVCCELTLSAASTQCECGVDSVLDSEQHVEQHWAARSRCHCIRVHARLAVALRVVAVHAHVMVAMRLKARPLICTVSMADAVGAVTIVVVRMRARRLVGSDRQSPTSRQRWSCGWY